ncbi:pilus assembly FimT family protein [Acinetobacter sp. Ver3]|uniref:pilus assembly FimT family protein n=1 Tax=Acinetobacter sp. Ver3 TaxID=466088 RepID=UPI000447E1FB|nr:prepilin-type N-terminal cleavage/methylation domain-containing protein [Acinetobacter sp. Ver3]EZQ12252.1 pili assembly chaperone [Acinetobacter sp. Ver3]
MKDLQRGFTIIELLITTIVLSITATMAIPSFKNIVAQYRLNSDVRELSSVLMMARNQATLLRKDVTVDLQSNQSDSNTIFHWTPKAQNKLTSSQEKVTFWVDGGISDFTSDINFSICNKVLGVSKTIAITRMGTQYLKAEGTC